LESWSREPKVSLNIKGGLKRMKFEEFKVGKPKFKVGKVPSLRSLYTSVSTKASDSFAREAKSRVSSFAKKIKM